LYIFSLQTAEVIDSRYLPVFFFSLQTRKVWWFTYDTCQFVSSHSRMERLGDEQRDACQIVFWQVNLVLVEPEQNIWKRHSASFNGSRNFGFGKQILIMF
jgi:hypothetical protein